MKFSYSEVWNEAVDLLRANAAVFAALAGVFFFLPELLFSYFFPDPPGRSPDPNEALRLFFEYFWNVLPWLLLAQIVKSIGGITMFLILLRPSGATVGGTIAASLLILPFYFLASCLSLFIVAVGLILVIPGIYLAGRLSLVGPSIVAEGIRNPLAALGRSLELTKGKGWAVVGLLLLVIIAGYIAVSVASWIFGSLFILAAGKDVGLLLAQIITAAGLAAFSTLITCLVAALYRQIAGTAPSASPSKAN